MIAAQTEGFSCLEILRKTDIDFNCINIYGENSLLISVWYHNWNCFDFLFE